MLCKQCGFSLSDPANFCPNCGKKLTKEDQPKNTPQKRSVKWLKILLGLILVALVAFTLMILFSDTMTDTVSDQLEAIKENKIDEAYYNFTSKAFQHSTSVESFREFVNSYPVFLHNKSVRFIDRHAENDTGSLHAMILTDQKVEIPVQYRLVKEENKWLVEGITLEDDNSENSANKEKESSSAKDQEQTAFIAPIEFQLQSFQKRKLKESFDVLSKDFLKKMSWEKFESFVKSHPIFFQYISVSYESIQNSKEKGSVHARLESRKDQVVVVYQLVKEEGKWKISDMEFVGNEPTRDINQLKADEIFDSKPLENAIKEFLNQVRQQHLKKAYDNYTAEDFQKTTSFKEFEEFVKNNPSFANNQSVELDDLSFDNNLATMAGILKGANGKIYPAEFDLIEEKGAWKVFHVQVLNPDERVRQSAAELKFSQFILGSSLGEDGLVKSPKTVFKIHSGDIYLNLYVDGVPSNTTIQVIFEHEDSHSQIPPISKLVTENGNVILTFIFSPPSSGWPKGNYRILTSSSTGKSSIVNFKVED